MLAPQAFLAAAVRRAGARSRASCCASLAGVAGVAARSAGRRTPVAGGLAGLTVGVRAFDHLSPPVLVPAGVARTGAGGGARPRRGAGSRCGGCRPGAAAASCRRETEYTATAFSKPLMMIFRGVYRPTREVRRLESVRPTFRSEVRYRSRDRAAPSSATSTGPLRARCSAWRERLQRAPGRQPSRLPRLRARARRAAALVAGRTAVTTNPLPVALFAVAAGRGLPAARAAAARRSSRR